MSHKPLGFEHQPPYEGSCGAYALGHALNLVGKAGEIQNHKDSSSYVSWSRSVEKNFRLSGLFNRKTYQKIYNEIGTSDRGIPKGIKSAGCIPKKIDNYSKPTSRKILDSNLKRGYPIILFANWDKDEEDDGHWYVCAGKSGDKYIMIDSLPLLARKKVISLYSWEEIVKRSIVYDEDENYFNLYGFAVQPKDGISAVPRLHKYLNYLFRDELLREWWGYYLEDLTTIFYKTGNGKEVINSKDFFSKYSSVFLENIRYWNTNIERSRIEKELNNYKLIAEIYDLAVSKTNLDEALIGFTTAIITAAQVD